MHLTKKGDYAVRAMLELARYPFGEVVQTRAIAQAQSIPESFLSKIIQSLARARLIMTARGVQGGVQLALPAERITIRQIVEAVEGPIALNRCAINPELCDRSSFCRAHPFWVKINDLLAAELEKATLAGMAAGRL